jgi:hypothetical protein
MHITNTQDMLSTGAEYSFVGRALWEYVWPHFAPMESRIPCLPTGNARIGDICFGSGIRQIPIVMQL